VDNITTRTIEVTLGRIYDYKVNYSTYLGLNKERRQQQQKQFDEQQKFISIISQHTNGLGPIWNPPTGWPCKGLSHMEKSIRRLTLMLYNRPGS
jgi:hypothetical protein